MYIEVEMTLWEGRRHMIVYSFAYAQCIYDIVYRSVIYTHLTSYSR